MTTLFVLLMAAQSAEAQDLGFDAHGFHLAAHDADLRDPLVVQRPGPFSQGDLFASLLAEYAKAPLVRVSEAELSNDTVEEAVLDNLVGANLSLGVAPHDLIRLDVVAPIYLVSSDQSIQATDGPAPGDVRGSVMLMGVRPDHIEGGGGIGLGLIGHVDVPAGTPDRFLGQQGVAGGVRIAATYEWPVVTLSGDVGTQFNPALDVAENINNSDTLIASVGIGALASDSVGLTAEIAASPPFQPPQNLLFPAESILSLRYRDQSSGAYWTFGGAAGLTNGPGVAAFRVFIGGGIAKQEPPRAPDFDVIGAFKSRDECPLELENKNGWQDDDGCPDTLAALAIETRYLGEPIESEAEITGPEGTETEYIGRGGMQKNAVPGSEWSVKARSGKCLAGEGNIVAREGGTALRVDLFQRLEGHVKVEVVGSDDQPLESALVTWAGEQHCVPDVEEVPVNQDGVVENEIGVGTHHLTVVAPGHKVHDEDVEFVVGDRKHIKVKLEVTRIRVEKKQIVILEKVHFETAKAVIRPISFPLLNEVAETIITNPDLGRVEVAGHTDNRGSDSYNQGLSERRSASVKNYLIEQGVSADRLLAVGYGESKPIDTNKTPEGREHNRRVEFNLIDAGPNTEAPPPVGGDGVGAPRGGGR